MAKQKIGLILEAAELAKQIANQAAQTVKDDLQSLNVEVAHIKGKLGIDPNSISKMNIKGKMLVTTPAGTTAIPLADIKSYVRTGCHACEDFSSELADVSVGGLGLDGWTFTIIRTDKGEELFTNAEKTGFLESKPIEEGAFPKTLLLKLTKKKHEKPTAPQVPLKQ